MAGTRSMLSNPQSASVNGPATAGLGCNGSTKRTPGRSSANSLTAAAMRRMPSPQFSRR